ncbi:MAG: EamA family transporter [Chitinophagaceae bacterium]|nr:EamA family transporter [Chitinophagaceae bacterium]
MAPIDKISLALTIILAILFLKEPATPKVIIGACLIIAGTLVIAIK